MKVEEQSLEATGKPCSLYEMSRTHWLAITHILFEVLLLLRKDNQISVADAIWHSVMNAHWRKGNCPESVSDFPEQLTIEKREGMFKLDKSPDGSFEQKWLVDSIMDQGGFWVGRLVRISREDEYSHGIPQLNLETLRAASAAQADDVATIPEPPSLPASAQSFIRTRSGYQLSLSMLIQLFNHVSITSDNDQEEAPMFAPAALADYCASLALSDDRNTRNSELSLQQQRAVFDIKGDASGKVLVVTPFQKRLETLPRPLTRSMSVSWVVQPVVPPPGGSEGMEEHRRPYEWETLKTLGMVRGMWKYMVHTINSYRLV